jgi:hypothetical protein
MKINNENLNFTGLWRKSTKAINNPKDFQVSNVYIETQTYHPFKDELVSDGTRLLETTKGTNYYEYDGNNFGGGVESSIAVQSVEIGESLDITRAQYEELLRIQKAGLEATKKLNALGSIEMYSMNLPTSKENGVTLDASDANPEIVEKILAYK